MSNKQLSPDEIFKGLADAVIDFDKSKVEDLAHMVIENKLDAYEAINKGLSHGVEVVGKRFDQGECFVPELLMAAKVMMNGFDILKPHVSGIQTSEKGVIVIGTVKGDLHSIGKDIVALIMEVSGFEVHNLGINIEHKIFMEKAEEYSADIVGLSALMSTTMNQMKTIVELFEQEGLRKKYTLMVGGAPVSQKWSQVIGADGFAPNAAKAVEVAQDLLRRKSKTLSGQTLRA
jgi:corrinoid protein of di/trimethylamine methyltransferase